MFIYILWQICLFLSIGMVKQEQGRHLQWRVRKLVRVVLGTKYVYLVLYIILYNKYCFIIIMKLKVNLNIFH
jgi:hypothetical protein